MIKLNGIQVIYGFFPNGELYIQKDKLIIKKYNYIKFIYEDQIDIIKLLLLQNHIKDSGNTSELYIQYLPYSRMDRVNNDYAFSLKAISDLINRLEFTKVIIREPHSIVSLGLINNSVCDEWCMDNIESVIIQSKTKSLFFPDKGAADRYQQDVLPVAFGIKSRDFKSGKITGFQINGNVTQNVLIVDDICSRGGTFMRAVEKLRGSGAIKISLLVAYCEENVHTGELFKYIDKLYTSSDCSVTDHPQIIKI